MPTITLKNTSKIVAVKGLDIYDKYLAIIDNKNVNDQQCINYLKNKTKEELSQNKETTDSLTIIIRDLYEKNIDYNTIKNKREELIAISDILSNQQFWNSYFEHLNNYVQMLQKCKNTRFWIDEKTKTDNHTLIIDLEYTLLKQFVVEMPEEFRVLIDLGPTLLNTILENGEADFHRLLCKQDLFFNEKTMNLLFDNYEKYKFCQLNCVGINVPNEYLKIKDYTPFDEESDEDITIEEMQEKMINNIYEDSSDDELMNDYFPLYKLKKFIEKNNNEDKREKIQNKITDLKTMEHIVKNTNGENSLDETTLYKDTICYSITDKKCGNTEKQIHLHEEEDCTKIHVVEKKISEPSLRDKNTHCLCDIGITINDNCSNDDFLPKPLKNKQKLTKQQKQWRKKIFLRNYFNNIDPDYITSSFNKKHQCNLKIIPNKNIHNLIFIVRFLLLCNYKEKILSMKIKYIAKMYYEMVLSIVNIYKDKTTGEKEITISDLIRVKDDCVNVINKYDHKIGRQRCSVKLDEILRINKIDYKNVNITQYDIGTYGYFVNIMDNLYEPLDKPKDVDNENNCSYITW